MSIRIIYLLILIRYNLNLNWKMELIERALEFETRKTSYKTTNERIVASRIVKALILDLNEIYKENKDAEIMDLMKRLTVIKRKIEKRLKGRPDS